MKYVLRLFGSLPLMAVAGFCLFGFVATFEPMPRLQQWLWRAIYAGAGSVSLVAIGWIWLRSKTSAPSRS